MIIGIGHQKQVGKDTAALALQNLGIAQKISFADALYEICWILLPDFKEKRYYDEDGERKKELLSNEMTVREFLIHISQNLKSILKDDNIWTKIVAEKARNYRNVVIPDVRYPEEIKWIHEEGGIVVKLVRPSQPESSDHADDALLNFDGWDHVIYNDGTIKDLEEKFIDLCKDLEIC